MKYLSVQHLKSVALILRSPSDLQNAHRDPIYGLFDTLSPMAVKLCDW